MPDEGIEPPTFGLQNRCTTAVLNRPPSRKPQKSADKLLVMRDRNSFKRFWGTNSGTSSFLSAVVERPTKSPQTASHAYRSSRVRIPPSPPETPHRGLQTSPGIDDCPLEARARLGGNSMAASVASALHAASAARRAALSIVSSMPPRFLQSSRTSRSGSGCRHCAMCLPSTIRPDPVVRPTSSPTTPPPLPANAVRDERISGPERAFLKKSRRAGGRFGER